MENNQGQKKILIFSTAYLPLIGGAEIAVKEITQRLPNWQFDMITAKIKPGLANFEKIGNVNVYRTGLGFSFDKFLLPILGLLKAVRLNRKNNYRIVWSIMASQAGVAASFFKIFYPSKKLLLTLQEGDLERHLGRYVFGIKFLYDFLIKPWHLLPFKRSDYFTTISYSLRQRALDNGVNPSFIKVVPNGVDIKKFKRVSEERIGSLRKQLAIQSNERIILTVSRLVEKNGIDDLIRAGRYLDFPFRILIAGSGPDEKKLKSLAGEMAFGDKVVFLGDIENGQLPDYYSVADVFVRASRSEGFGNVFLEAMACGLPIVATLVGGIKDFLDDEKTGLVCRVNDPESIARKVKRALDGDMSTIVKNGQDLIREKYTWGIIAKEMEGIYLNLL